MTDATDAKLVERARDLVAWMDAHNHYPHQYTEPDCWEKAILRFAKSYADEQVKKEREACAQVVMSEDSHDNDVAWIAEQIRQRGGGEK